MQIETITLRKAVDNAFLQEPITEAEFEAIRRALVQKFNEAYNGWNCETIDAEGHLAVLGMTKMGKSTLAEKLIKQLQDTHNVAILDQTGEYVSKKGFPKCNSNTDYDNPGSYVIEPKPTDVPADKALSFFEFFMDKGVQEYTLGTPKPRTIVVEEAHQFIPEPAGLGFNDANSKI